MEIETNPNIHRLYKSYLTPQIKKIQIDNEISLALESGAPPEEPSEISENSISNTPYHTII